MTENTSPLSVFVTGGSTGAGRVLTRELVKRGHKVTATTTGTAGAAVIRADGGVPAFPDLRRPGDVRGLLQMARADVVVHLAASPLNDIPHFASRTNESLYALESTDELVIAAGRAGVKRLIFVSFAFLYGDTGGTTVDESAPLSTDHPLLKAAASAEMAVLDGGIPGYVLRSGYIYGSFSPGSKTIADRLKRGQAVVSGKKPACWIHEEDLAGAMALLAERTADAGLGEILNVVDDAPTTPDEFMKDFGAALNTGEPAKIPVFLTPWRTTAIQRLLLATSVKATNTKLKGLGWSPQYPGRAAGLERMLMLWRAEAGAEAPPAVLPERAMVTV